MNNYKDFLRKRDESWQDALKRFDLFCETDMMSCFSSKNYSYRFADNRAYDLYLKKPSVDVSLKEMEERFGANIPNELHDMLCRYGAWRIGDVILDIFSGEEDQIFLTLPEILAKYGYADFTKRIGKGMLASMSGFYFFFGISFPLSEEITFLFFSKSGNFGKMLFSPHNLEMVLKKVLPSMFNGTSERFTLDRLIGEQIDRVIRNALMVRGYID